MPDCSPSGSALLASYKRDLEHFARDHLRVLAKSGAFVPLHLNRAQLTLEAALDEQLERIGRVRKVLVKGRQLGCSTDVAARFVRDAVLKPGTRVAVIAHRKDATANLADMTLRFYDDLDPSVKVPVVERNQTSIKLVQKSSYKLTTAGQAPEEGGAGRSITATRLHASEFAFWAKGGNHIAGLGQALADLPGTEGIVESTAQGQSNALYELWMLACTGGSDWEPLFIPWFVEPTYSRDPPPGWRASREPRGEGMLSDHEYRETYDLTLGQMYWRSLKIAELSLGQNSLLTWCQEYPATPGEAFMSTGEAAFISAFHVKQARLRHIDPLHVRHAELVIACDPATSHGPDSTVIGRRRGPKLYGMEVYPNNAARETIEILWQMWLNERPVAIVVDRTGGGDGDAIVTELASRGVNVIGVYFGGRADAPGRFYDRRAELYTRVAAHLLTADIPDEAELARDLLAQVMMSKEQPQIRLKSKPDLRAAGHPSPDRADMYALTLAWIDSEGGDPHDLPMIVPDPHRDRNRPWLSLHPS